MVDPRHKTVLAFFYHQRSSHHHSDEEQHQKVNNKKNTSDLVLENGAAGAADNAVEQVGVLDKKNCCSVGGGISQNCGWGWNEGWEYG